MLHERREHVRRMRTLREEELEEELVQLVKRERLGHVFKVRKQRAGVKLYTPRFQEHSPRQTNIGAGGHSVFMASSTGPWPQFKYMLPEVALAGHTNCGKSSLANALGGIAPRKGPARISDRAGWTDQVYFYRVGKKPPVLTLADLPGYGFAVSTRQLHAEWTRMIEDYLTSRSVLTACCVLVDSERGLCQEDREFLRLLQRAGRRHLIALTKCDLLTPIEVCQSVTIVRQDLAALTTAATDIPPIYPVSSQTGAGINRLWSTMLSWAQRQAIPGTKHQVRVHKLFASTRLGRPILGPRR